MKVGMSAKRMRDEEASQKFELHQIKQVQKYASKSSYDTPKTMASESSAKSQPINRNKNFDQKQKAATQQLTKHESKGSEITEAKELEEILDQDSPSSLRLTDQKMALREVEQNEIKRVIRFDMSMSLFTLEEEDYDDTPVEERPASRSSRSKNKESTVLGNQLLIGQKKEAVDLDQSMVQISLGSSDLQPEDILG